MTVKSRIIMTIASLLLVGVYFMPLWNISLEAPQYPEGIGLRIWVDTIDGQNPHDLSKINNLNHYIGMKKIVPDSILELKYMPYIIGFMMLFGLLVAYTGKRKLLLLWLATFLMLSAAGLYDFYLWGYDYGHNLDQENAIIKIPGMSYQPPVIGRKQLLNFTAISLPASGGYLVILSILLAGWASLPWRKAKNLAAAKVINGSLLAILALSLFSCEPKPREIRYNEDACSLCMMGISDARFGAELVTDTHKVYTFDSIECLVAFSLAPDEKAHSMWVTDWQKPGLLIDATSAIYLYSKKIRSPMGLGVLAVSAKSQAKQLQKDLGGTLMDWPKTQLFASTQK
ncbi:MAG: nitrous oxide reductase accessory protein NosL [Calditrichia bacterium]